MIFKKNRHWSTTQEYGTSVRRGSGI